MWKSKEDFLAAVVADKRLRRWSTLAVAARLAAYVNSETQEAWPSIVRLAQDLGTDARTVRRAINDLSATRLLTIIRGGGKRRPNRYKINEGRLPPVSNLNEGPLPPYTGGGYPPEPKKEPKNSKKRRSGDSDNSSFVEPEGSRSSSVRSSRSPARGRQARLSRLNRDRTGPTYFPPNWEFGPAEATEAFNSLAQWSANQARGEFEKFRHWHAERRTRSPNWRASWIRWCVKGHEIETRTTASVTGRDKTTAAAAGVSGWYERQKAYDLECHPEGGSDNASADTDKD